VHGVMNAVLVDGDAVGPTLYYGAGAGAEPTASAVVADIVDVVRDIDLENGTRVPSLAFGQEDLSTTAILSMEQVETAYYLRMMANEKPGVLAQVTKILGERGISIEAIEQKGHATEQVPVVLLTNRVVEGQMNAAITAIEALDDIIGQVTRIRVEDLDG
jgi:homoserine dehydrogenase